jgi:hypothetical protein
MLQVQDKHGTHEAAAGSPATCVAASGAGGATWRAEERPAGVARATGGRVESHVVREGRRGCSWQLREAASRRRVSTDAKQRRRGSRYTMRTWLEFFKSARTPL